MPIIPRFDEVPSVLPDRQADAINRVDAGPAAFGAGIGDAVQRSAGVADQVAQRFNEVAANNAINSYTTQARSILYGDPSNSSQPGFLNLRGQAAVDAAPGVQTQLNDLYDTVGGSLTTTAQSSQFEQMARRYQNMDMNALSQHTAQQGETYASDSNLSTIKLTNQSAAASYNDPNAIQTNFERSDAAVVRQGQLLGWSPAKLDLARQTNREDMLTGIVQAAVGDSPERAQSLLVSYRPMMNPDTYSRLSESLAPKVNEALADRITQSITGNPNGAAVGVPDSADVGGVWNSMKNIESAGRQFGPGGTTLTSPIGGADAPVGVSQIRPSTARDMAPLINQPYDENRLRTDQSYNEALGKEYLLQMLQRYGGNRTLAVAAYNAGPATVDAWTKQYGDPRDGKITDAQFTQSIPADETRNYVTRVASENGAAPHPADGTGSVEPASYQVPDLGSQIGKAEAATAGMPIEVQDRVLAGVERNYHIQMAQTETARRTLSGTIADLGNRYMQGETSTAIPADTIRSLYPTEQANSIIGQLNVEQQAGIAFSGIKYASPDQEQAIRAKLEDPNSLLSQRIRVQGKNLVGPGVQPISAVAPEDGAAPPDDQETMALRDKVTERLEAMITAKHRALDADPVAYAAGAPTVRAAQAQVDPDKPDTFQAYVNASLAQQRLLGVQSPRILTNDQVQSITHRLSGADPAKDDVGQLLDQTANEYGSLWPQAFGELVQHGKLSPDYQTLAAMDTPGQTMARVDFQRSLQAGTTEQLKTAAGGTATSLIDGTGVNRPIDVALEPFKRTVAMNTGGVGLYNTVRSSVQRLAYYYSSQGQDGTQALNNAVSGVLGRYDFSGTMRVPKGMLSNVQAATSSVTTDLKASDLAPAPGNPSLTQSQRQDIMLGAARNGSWVPNADDTGLVLMASLRNGSAMLIRGSNGQPISVRFDDVRAGRYAPPPAQGPSFDTSVAGP